MNKLMKKIMTGVVICGIMLGNISVMPANASQADKQNKNSAVIKVKEKQNNKRHVNQGKSKGKSWNQTMIQAESKGVSDKKVKVAIIDSGINFSTDIDVAVRKNFIEDDSCSILYEDEKSHGTSVAGIIAALDNEEGITGINPRVELYSARVLDTKLEAPVDRIVKAIDWAIEQKVDIINMSFGIEKNIRELEEAIERAYDAGILMIAAVGNGDKIAYPAAYDEVIAVGAVNAEGIPIENNAVGEALELMAPGENIFSSAIFGGVQVVSGTSMAVPHVTGVASVLMELNPEMPAEYIRALMNYSANLCGSQDIYGNGIVDLQYAIKINDKFEKMYQKYLKNVEKGNKQKQIDKFWKEVTKNIPENEKAVEVFTGLEVVEGMWLIDTKNHSDYEGKLHTDFIDDGTRYTEMHFSDEQKNILIYACKYPDKYFSAAGEPYHGHLWKYVKNGENWIAVDNSNYIANYLFLTKVARAYGDANSVPQGAVTTYDYEKMVSEITTTSLGGRTWEAVFNTMNVEGKTSIPLNQENKKLFIYGISLHQVTDIFAHSAWAKKAGESKWTRVTHSSNFEQNADNSEYIKERYNAATEAAKGALFRAYYGSEGLLAQFMYSKFYFGTFYLGNFSPYAKAVSAQVYNAGSSTFDAIDLQANVGNNYSYQNGMTYFVP